jgi:hypothetical protein
MVGRREYKYLVPMSCLKRLRADIRPYLEIDRYSARRDELQYTVRSIYYDTPRLEFYNEKVEGTKARMKLRVRAYDEVEESSLVFLEIKRKNGNFIHKNRAPLLLTHLAQFLATHDIDQHIIAACGMADAKADARRFLFHYCGRALRPTVLAVYEREAYTGRFNPGLRVTLDKNLRSISFPSLDMLYDEAHSRSAMRRHCILELKFCESLPAWVRRAVRRHELQRMALSKYTICLDSHGRSRRPAPAPIRDTPQRVIACSYGNSPRVGVEVPSAA